MLKAVEVSRTVVEPQNDQGHRAVTFGFQSEIAGEHGSGAPPCYAAWVGQNPGGLVTAEKWTES